MKNHIANFLIRFFRAFLISIPVSIVLFLLLFFVIYDAGKTFNIDVSDAKVVLPETQSETSLDSINARLDEYKKKHPKTNNENNNHFDFSGFKKISKEDVKRAQPLTFQFGNEFNAKAFYLYNANVNGGIIRFDDTENLKEEITNAIKYYQKTKLTQALRYSFVVLLGLPLLIAIIYLLTALFSSSIKWIDENKTI